MSTFNLNITAIKMRGVNKLNQDLLKVCKDVYKNKNSVQFSNEGYQSPRLNLKEYPVFLDLFTKTKEHIVNMLKIYDVLFNTVDVSLPWVNVNKPGDFNWSHKHLDSHFSLVYYLKVPKKSGDVIFKNPFTENNNFFLKSFKNYNSNNSNVYKYTPEESFLLMFPSNLEHAVEKNKSKQNRISIAFDVTIK
jgi:uncharacterized protein (TIGR02466 family)